MYGDFNERSFWDNFEECILSYNVVRETSGYQLSSGGYNAKMYFIKNFRFLKTNSREIGLKHIEYFGDIFLDNDIIELFKNIKHGDRTKIFEEINHQLWVSNKRLSSNYLTGSVKEKPYTDFSDKVDGVRREKRKSTIVVFLNINVVKIIIFFYVYIILRDMGRQGSEYINTEVKYT